MPTKPRVEATRDSLHSFIEIDDTMYAVLQEWELWYTGSMHREGYASLEAIPNGNVFLVPLKDCVNEESIQTVLKNQKD